MVLFQSVLLFILFAVYFFYTVYFFNQNLRGALNRSFFGICIALCAWSLGLAMSVTVAHQDLALIWRKISILGWALIYALILQFIMLLTGTGRYIKSGLFHPLFFAPAFIVIVVFCFVDEPAGNIYCLIRSYAASPGARPGVWNIFFIAYYTVYSLMSIFILLRWKRRSADNGKRRQANLILYALAVTLFLELLSDAIMNITPSPAVAMLSPVKFLFPFLTIFFLMKKYKLIMPNEVSRNQLIMSDLNSKRLYHSLSTFMLLFGIGNIIALLLKTGSSPARHFDIIYSLFLVFFGLVFVFIQYINSKPFKEALNIFLMLISIPLFSLIYMERFPNIYWIIPIIFAIPSLVYNKRSVLVLVSVDAVLTQAIIWLHTPKGSPLYAGTDYILRIALYVLMLFIGWIVNMIYLEKLKETARQADLQKLVSDMSYDFAHVTKTNLKRNIEALLSRTGNFWGADRSFIFRLDNDKGIMTLKYEWCREGIMPELVRRKPCRKSDYPNLMREMFSFSPVYFEDIRKHPVDLVTNKDMFVNKDVVSFVAVPIITNNMLYGFHALTTYSSKLKISQEDLDTLRMLAGLIANRYFMLKANRDIEYMAYFDNLTGLPNRFLFDKRTMQVINNAKKTGASLGCIFLNLNSFKFVNDSLGYKTGDDVLKKVADSIVKLLRRTDIISRFDGDKFIILLNPVSGRAEIEEIANSVITLFESPFKLHKQEFYITANAGISVFPDDGTDNGTLVKNADIALNKARAAGPNRYAICNPEMREDIVLNTMLSNGLFRALERGEFVVYYQPLIDIETTRICGFEALLRWDHPELGLINPSLFIPLAEKNGLISTIGEWILKTACAQSVAWKSAGHTDLRMSVNLSATQFYNPRLADIVKNVIDETGMTARQLDLEITESAAVTRLVHTDSTIKKLRELGVTITIDDFGTEYSSLIRLKKLTIDRIKIDMQFVQNLEQSEQDRAIAVMIINLAKNLGLQVTAEGIETEYQLRFLKDHGCNEAQGFYYFRPLPPEELERFL